MGSLNSLTENHVSCIQGGLYSLPQTFTGWVTTYCFLTAGRPYLQSELIKFLRLQTAANQSVSVAPWFDTVLVCITQLVFFSLRVCWQLPEREGASQQPFSSLIRKISPSYRLLWFWLRESCTKQLIAIPFLEDLSSCSLPAGVTALTLFALRSTSLDFPALIFFAFVGKHSTFICLLPDFTTCPPFCPWRQLWPCTLLLLEGFCPFKPNTSLLQPVRLKWIGCP